MELLAVGQIVKTVGLKGEVKVYPSTHFRDSRFKVGNHLFLSKDGENLTEVTIKVHHKNGNVDQLVFNEFKTIEEVEGFVGFYLYVEKDRKFLKKDNYFYSDLIGLDVYFDNGNYIGKVSNIEEYASYSTLRVKQEDKKAKDVLIPFLNAFVSEVDLENKKIIIKFIEGLLWKLKS